LGATESNGSAHAANATERRPARPLAPTTQRERLLDAMARTVSRHGYAGTSVAEVLKVARISRRTFYEQFIDKEDCFLAAYDAIATLCADRVAAAYRAEARWDEALARAFETLLEVLAAEPDFARLAVVEALGAGPRGLERRDEALRSLVALIEDARERAELAVAPPALVAQAIAGGIYELVHARLVHDQAAALPELAGDVLHYAFMLLGASRPELTS
jgi:AcrR family transcriptional regulator